ncbi:LptF/LptG family permease [bacterium]|nr:LptF/LptG family permease [bacterium]
MKTLYAYIIKELIGPIVISGFFFTFVLLIVRLFDWAEILLQSGISGDIFLHLLGVVVVTLLSLTIPMAILLGTLIAIGRLTNENEILAIRVAGISLTRAFVPAVVFGLLVSAALMWGNSILIPRMFGKVDDLRYRIQFELLTNLQPGRFYGDLGPKDTEVTLFFEERAGGQRASNSLLEMRGVNMRIKVEPEAMIGGVDGGDRDREFLIFSDKGTIEGDLTDQQLNVVLSDGLLMPTGPENQSATTTFRFSEMTMALEGGSEDAVELAEVRPREMDFFQLREYLSNPPTIPVLKDKDHREMYSEWKTYFSARNEMLQRFTLPFSALAFILIAIPLGIEVRPRAKSLSFLVAFVLMAVYYALLTLGAKIGQYGVGMPIAIFALMLPNLIIGGLGILMLYRAQWR